MTTSPDALAELSKLGPDAAARLERVRTFLASPNGRGEAAPVTAADVERIEAQMARPAKSIAERMYPNLPRDRGDVPPKLVRFTPSKQTGKPT